MRGVTLILLLGSLSWGQVATEANRSYEEKDSRQSMLRVLSSPRRAERLRADEMVARLELQAGQTVVDLGTGAGFLLPYLSSAVGPSGRVVAQDIHQDFLDAAHKTATETSLSNVSYLLGGEREARVPAGTADLILTVDAYHHFDYPEPMLEGIRAGLKDGGRFAVVDYYKNGFRDPDHIRADKPEVIREVESGGFRLVRDIEHVPDRQYLLIFERE